MINVLFSADRRNWASYEPTLKQAFLSHGLSIHLSTEIAPDKVDYIVYTPSGGLLDFAPFTRCKAVLSLWAGVEKIVTIPSLTQPLCRMVDPGLTKGMVEWVLGHTLRYHLDIDRSLAIQNGKWKPVVPPLASERTVGVLGLGALGKSCAKALHTLGFNVLGWSRRPKDIPGISTLHGPDGLEKVLQETEILVLLLPDTAETENTLNQNTVKMLPKGARVLNPGRGSLIDDTALLSALDDGHIAHATLDVFRVEPLPTDHAYWSHPKVTVTPHIAAETRALTASDVIAENIYRGESGKPFLHLVDRTAGY